MWCEQNAAQWSGCNNKHQISSSGWINVYSHSYLFIVKKQTKISLYNCIASVLYRLVDQSLTTNFSDSKWMVCASASLCMYVCLYICTYAHARMHTHARTHKHTQEWIGYSKKRKRFFDV